MTSRRNRLLGAILVALSLALAAPALGGRVPPKPGDTYAGKTSDGSRLTLRIDAGRSIEIVAWSFDCGDVTGATSLQDIKVKRSSEGYRFAISARGIVSFSDEGPDENASMSIKGTFSASAKKVAGRLRVDARRCDTGYLTWTATRR